MTVEPQHDAVVSDDAHVAWINQAPALTSVKNQSFAPQGQERGMPQPEPKLREETTMSLKLQFEAIPQSYCQTQQKNGLP